MYSKPRNKNKIIYYLVIILSLLSSSIVSAAGQKHVAYYDTLTDQPWYDGVKSTIDHVDPVVNSMSTSAWCGIDNNGTNISNIRFVQAGWAKKFGDIAKIYWEYTDETGDYDVGFVETEAPADTETYQVSREGANCVWRHNGAFYKVMSWTLFDGIKFCKAQYGAEMIREPDDHTPGGVNNENTFANCQVRREGGGFETAELAVELNNSTQGRIQKFDPPAPGNFFTWDVRD